MGDTSLIAWTWTVKDHRDRPSFLQSFTGVPTLDEGVGRDLGTGFCLMRYFPNRGRFTWKEGTAVRKTHKVTMLFSCV